MDAKFTTALSCLGLLIYSCYYYFNLIILIKTAKTTFINDEMANLTWAHMVEKNVTFDNKIINAKAPASLRGALSRLLRGQVLTLNSAFEKGLTYDRDQFQMSVLSGFPLCKDRIDNGKLLYYNDIAFSICNNTRNIKSLTQLLQMGNSHVSLDSLIIIEKLMANSTSLCDVFHRTAYLYPSTDQAIESKAYLNGLCMKIKQIQILKEDSLLVRQKKISAFRESYKQVFDKTTVSTHLISSNVIQAFNLSMAASSTRYKILSKKVKQHANHNGIFSYGFKKWGDFAIRFCFQGQDCVKNQQNWLIKAAKSGFIKNSFLPARILNYSNYDRTPIDFYVDLPSSYLPSHDFDTNQLSWLSKRNDINMTTLHPKDMNLSIGFDCRDSSLKESVFNSVVVHCNSPSESPAESFSGLTSCTMGCTERAKSPGVFWALRVIKCVGNDSLIDLISTTTPKLIPYFKNLTRLDVEQCQDILDTFAKFNYDAYEFQVFVRDSDPKNTTTTQLDYANLVKYKNPIHDMLLLANGTFDNDNVRYRYGKLPTLLTSNNVNIQRILFNQCLYRIIYKINGLIYPGEYKRISLGLSNRGLLYFGFIDVAALDDINILPGIQKDVTIPTNLSFYVQILLLFNLVTTTFYFLLLFVNCLVFRTRFPVPKSVIIVGRLCIYLPGGKLISMITGMFGFVAVRQALAQKSILEIITTPTEFYEFLILHLAASWILYVFDDFSGEILYLNDQRFVKISFWIYFCCWSIITLPLKGRERIVFTMDIHEDTLVGIFQIVSFSLSQILFDLGSIVIGWFGIKILCRSRMKYTLSYEPNFETVYSRPLCNILYANEVFSGNASLIRGDKINDYDNGHRNFQIEFDHYNLSSTLTTLWVNSRLGFDFRLWKWIRCNRNKTLIFAEAYLTSDEIKVLDSLPTISPENIMPNHSECSMPVIYEPSYRYKNDVTVIHFKFLKKVIMTIGLVFFLLYHIAMQYELLNLVDKVFENDEMSELSIEHMTSTDLNLIRLNASGPAPKNVTTSYNGFLFNSILLDNFVLPLEDAIKLGFRYPNDHKEYFWSTMSPCSLRLLHRHLENESYTRHFWSNVLCQYDNDYKHQNFTKQGNFMSATDSMILTQKLLFNSTHYCDDIFNNPMIDRNDFYINPISIETNNSIVYLTKLCADMGNSTLKRTDIITKYKDIIKEIKVSKYFSEIHYSAYFSLGYQASKYYFSNRFRNRRLHTDYPFYSPGPGNWECCGFHQCFQSEKRSQLGPQKYESLMLSYGYGKLEHISRAKNYSIFDGSPISYSFEGPAVFFPNFFQDSKLMYKLVQKIEKEDQNVFKDIKNDKIESKTTSKTKYAFASFTKAICPLFTTSNIDYQLSGFSGCASKKSTLSVIKSKGILTTLRVLKCLQNDTLIDLLHVSPQVSSAFKNFQLPSDNSCKLLLGAIQRLDWTVSPFMYIRSRNKSEQSDMVLAKYYNPLEEMKKIKFNSLTADELQNRVGGLAHTNRADSLSILLYVSMERIRDKVNSILNPGLMHLFQAGVYQNGSLYYGTIPIHVIQEVNILPKDTKIEVSNSYSSFVKMFVMVDIGYTFFYMIILFWSMYSRSIPIPKTVMEIGRIVLVLPGGHLIAVSNGLYSIVGIRQYLSVNSVADLTYSDIFSLAAMHLGASWFLRIADDLSGEIIRLPDTFLRPHIPLLYLLAHGFCTLSLKSQQKIFLVEKLGVNEGASEWKYIFDIQKFGILDIIFDVLSLVLGWMLVKFLVRSLFKLPQQKFNPAFHKIYSTIICNVLNNSLKNRNLIFEDKNNLISFDEKVTVGLSTLWFSKTKGFDFQSFKFVELSSGRFNALAIEAKQSISKQSIQKLNPKLEDLRIEKIRKLFT